MKTTMMTLLLVLSTSLYASESLFDCEMGLPKGIGEMKVSGFQKGETIELDFLNESLNRVLEGRFSISFVNKATGQFVATGTFVDGHELIDASLQGEILPDQDGVIRFAMHASWDHRIEYGYGNHVRCEML